MPFANLSEGQTLEEAVTDLEMQMIRSALSRHNWNMSRTAVELGLTRRGLYLKLARYGIEKAGQVFQYVIYFALCVVLAK